MLFPDIANFHEVQDYSRRRISCDGDGSNHCFTTRGSFRCYEVVRLCAYIYITCIGAYISTRYVHNYVCLRNWHTIPQREICMYFTQRGVHFPLQSRACNTSNFASNYREYLNTSQSTHTRSRTWPFFVGILRQRSRNISP